MKVNNLKIAILFFLWLQSNQPAPADPIAPQPKTKTTAVSTLGSAKSQSAAGKQTMTKPTASNTFAVKSIPARPLKTANTQNAKAVSTSNSAKEISKIGSGGATFTTPRAPNTNKVAGAQKPLILQGHIKHHKNPFKSLLKEEFDSPIHPITTDNKDF